MDIENSGIFGLSISKYGFSMSNFVFSITFSISLFKKDPSGFLENKYCKWCS